MIRYHPEEFIGGKIRVLHAKNKSLEHVKGRIIDETKNAFEVLTDNDDEKTVLKQGAVFMINNNEVKGDDILHRPEERTKLKA